VKTNGYGLHQNKWRSFSDLVVPIKNWLRVGAKTLVVNQNRRWLMQYIGFLVGR
jgi:hypothetical protein